MISKIAFLSFFRFGLCLLGHSIVFSGVLAAQDNVPSRAPFVLELPEITEQKYTLPIIRLPMKDVPSIKVRVLEPFATSINYGSIILTLNGDGINRGCSKSRDADGKIVLCGNAMERLRGFAMKPGKNILEIRATDVRNKEFYASYVIMLGDRSAPVDGAFSLGKPERFLGRKFAVIVGVSNYKYADAGLKSLNYADDDAGAIAEFLKTRQGGQFAAADIKLLLNESATIAGVRSALNDVAKRARANDLVFIFIAGHGAPDPLASQNLYFLLHDTKVVDMPNTAYPMSELKQYLDSQVMAQRVLVMIDTCHSAGVNQKTKSIVTGRQLEHEGDENNISNFYLSNQLFRQTGRAILTSSDVNEISQESTKWGNHGVFTWALLEGMKGAADANGDNLITAGEIFQFTRTNVRKATNSQQNPIALPGSALNLTLAFSGNQTGVGKNSQAAERAEK
jgi:hypothetical protein